MEQTKEQMEQLYVQTFKAVKEGDLVEGTVLYVTSKDVIVDINYKSEGRIPSEEVTDIIDLKPGDKILAIVDEVEGEDGMPLLSKRKADRQFGWENLLKNFKEGDLIEGKIIKKIKGGLMVDIGMEAFLPISQILQHPKQNLSGFEKKKLKFKIMKINRTRKNVILSRKEAISSEKEQTRTKILQSLEPGQIKKGIIKNITGFGAFIDIGGVDGLLHITDITWGRIKHPSEYLFMGKEVEVMVLNVDKEKQKISLGMKQMSANPWESIEEKYPIGTKVQGKVVNIVSYGVFVELENGIEGLAHISEFSWTRKINHPQEMFKLGDIVTAAVLSIERANQRIALGLKQLEPNPWENIEERFNVGSQAEGVIKAFSEQGAIVELEGGIDGIIHNSDISWTRYINHPSEVFKKGERLSVIVLAIDTDGQKISLGLKQLQENPWPGIVEKYTVGRVVEGIICKITNFGTFVELEQNLQSPTSAVEGLIHISGLNIPENKNIIEFFKEGMKVLVKVIKIDEKQKKIGLALEKKLNETQ